MNAIEEHNKFWDSFQRDLFETGFAEVIRSCGANSVETAQDAIKAMCYLKGYADARREIYLSLSVKWGIANLLACAAGMYCISWEEIPSADPQKLKNFGEKYTRALVELLEKL